MRPVESEKEALAQTSKRHRCLRKRVNPFDTSQSQLSWGTVLAFLVSAVKLMSCSRIRSRAMMRLDSRI